MKSRIIVLITIALLAGSSKLQSQSKKEVENVKNLCGCFEVTFQYAETLSTDTAYHTKKPYYAKGLEYVVMDKGCSNTNMVLQHLLVAYDTLVIKHWREDWQYQNQTLLKYDVNHTWNKKQLDPSVVKKEWTQKVYEVNDAPRYEGTAYWSQQDGHPVWVSTVDAPLPRRDYSKRSDYNVMKRTNRVHVMPNQWIHEQDNYKIIRGNGKDSILVQEKGWNIYTRINDSKCQAAKKWWDEHAAFWALPRKG